MTAAYNGFGGRNQRFSPATRAQLSNASLFRGAAPASPTRASYQFSNRQAVANPRLDSAANRQFFQHQQPRYQGGFRSAAGGVNGSRSNMQGYAGRNGSAAAPRTSAGGWQRFGAPGGSNGLRQGFTNGQEQSGWHRFGQPQQSGTGVGSRSGPAVNYGTRSYGPGSYGGGNYQTRAPSAQRPQSFSGYGRSYSGAYAGGRSTYSAPRYSAPSAQHYSAPHYSAPSSRGGGGSSHGGGSPRGDGSSHGDGGGHSSSGGHHSR